MPVRYTVFFEPEEEGGFHVYCPALPGCHSYGDTKEEALKNIREAIAAYLGSLKKDGLPFIDTACRLQDRIQQEDYEYTQPCLIESPLNN